MSSPALAGALARRCADEGSYRRWRAQAAATGWCEHPVRLSGQVHALDSATGELRTVLDTQAMPDGTLLTACGNRRVSVCRPCAQTYRADTWQLVAAGLRGGKGVPETVGAHPRVFLTLTAPSFGAVHSRRAGRSRGSRPCRPRRGGVCIHGRPRGCAARHGRDDPLIGTPLCEDCYDYAGAVLWNARVPLLWSRTTTAIRRALAAEAGLSRAQAARCVRLAFTKVAEYQARGVVHLHAVLRLDAAPPPGQPGALAPPPAGFTAELLVAAIRRALPAACAPAPGPRPGVVGRAATWGAQCDLRVITASSATANPTAIAAYVAKYATKSTEALGAALAHRLLAASEIEALPVSAHLRRILSTCWELGGQAHLAELGLRRWAHALGFRGHFSTRSRRYSTTLTLLRSARARWQAERRGDTREVDPWDGEPEAGSVELVAEWRYAGTGYVTALDELLAAGERRAYLDGLELRREHRRAQRRLRAEVA